MEVYKTPILNENVTYLRHIKMNLDEIPPVNKVGKIIQFENGLFVNVRSTRTRLFIERKDYSCHCCGIKTQFAVVEDNSFKSQNNVKATPHLNFYGIDYAGKEVLMTWDHIQPRSLGGKNNLDNAQCLCCYCNTFKGNSYTFEEVKQHRIEKGMPITYQYDDNGNATYIWR